MNRISSLYHRLGEGWSLAIGSLAVIGVLAFLLRSPWDPPLLAGQTLKFYCANGMNRPVDDIIHDYQQKYGVTVQASYDGSGNLLSSIRAAGGAGDLFLSADSSFMRDARNLGLVAEVIPVAIIRPVLVVHGPTQERLQKEGRPVTSLKDLLRDDLKVCLANPEGTAIGRVGKAILEKAGVWQQLEERRGQRGAKVSTVGTVNMVAQQVRTNADSIGLVWDALARQFPALAVVPLPSSAETTEHIEIAVLRKSANPTAALHFARYLTARDQGLQAFARYQFEPMPDADAWQETPELHLAAGAMLEPGVRQVVKEFSQREGVRINTSYAGCGILVSQMESIRRGQKPGRFPDAYLSCDITFTEKVQPWFEPARIIFENRLVMIVRKGNPLNIKSLDDLRNRPELKLGLPHPQNSAIGKLIQDLLVQLKFPDDVYDPTKNRNLVHADAAHTLVIQMCTGHLDVAIVGRSNALSNPANLANYLDVIEVDHPAAVAVQTFSIARDSNHRYVMGRFRDTLMSPECLSRFEQLGFTIKTK
jgi:molybdenum ABC transporter molybdate-binding protein